MPITAVRFPAKGSTQTFIVLEDQTATLGLGFRVTAETCGQTMPVTRVFAAADYEGARRYANQLWTPGGIAAAYKRGIR